MHLDRLPKGFVARPPVMSDVEEVTRLIAACELATDGVADIDEEDVRSDWSRPSFDLDRDVVVVTTGGRIVGHASEYAGRATVAVDPAHRGKGVGTALLWWTEEHARTAGAGEVGQTLSENDAGARALLRAHGYEVGWDSWVFHLALPAPATPPPAGISIRPLRRPDDERAAHEVIDTAFNEWPGRVPVAFDDWLASHVNREDTDAGLMFVALDADTIIGAAICLVSEEEGWVEQLAVNPAYRGRRIGQALLGAAFGEFHNRGLRTAGLSTDSRTGARALYEKVGMRVVRSYARFSKAV